MDSPEFAFPPSPQMDSRRIAGEWSNLPAELLEIISGGLGNPSETVRFRSVCRSWRFSTPPPPNKLSPLFPLRAPSLDKRCRFQGFCDVVISASAVYLLRPRSDPSKAWMVSLQESTAGKLVLRDALVNTEMNGGADLELAKDWIAATQSPVARSYSHNLRCSTCKSVTATMKAVLVCESSGSGSESSQLVGLCAYPYTRSGLVAFRIDSGKSGHEDSQLVGHHHGSKFHDFVKFNGRVFAVDLRGHIYLVDLTNLQLLQMTENPVRKDIGKSIWVQFVVSDGDLYLVWISLNNTPPCQIYRLVVITDENNKIRILVEQVEDLGDRVFFITRKCSFSISARLLPPPPSPWQGNCVFIAVFPSSMSMCRCFRFSSEGCEYHHALFHLGGQTLTWISSSQGYSDLFSVGNAERSFRMGVFRMGVF